MATCLGVIIQLYVILKNRERKDLSSILPKMIDACIWVEDETNIYCNFVRPWLKMINACKKADLVLLISIKHNLLKRNLSIYCFILLQEGYIWEKVHSVTL